VRQDTAVAEETYESLYNPQKEEQEHFELLLKKFFSFVE
jgi:hypothetical protein